MSDLELSDIDISNKTEAVSIKPTYTGIPKQMEIMPNRVPQIHKRIIDLNDLVNRPCVYKDMIDKGEPDAVSTNDNNRQIDIYEEMTDKGEPDAVSTHDNNRQIDIFEEMTDKGEPDAVSTHDNNRQSTNQIDKTPSCKGINSCKLALALLVSMVITVLVVSLILWGVIFRDKENKKAEPETSLTTIALIKCLNNNSKHCNNSIETELTDIKENNTSKNNSLLMRQETTTRSGKNGTSPANHKITASIGFTAWATSVVSYSAGTTLIFNGMDENDEGHDGFDRSTGLFTCPITGIYYVYITLRKNNLSNIYVDVFKMDTRIIHFYHNYTGNPWITVSNSALVPCSVGEIIQMKGWSSGSIYGEGNVRFSSFTVIIVDQIAGNSPYETFVRYSGYANSQSLSRGDPINFPNQICNVGNHYSRNRFTCPYTGIYFVGVTYWRHPSDSFRAIACVLRGDTKVVWSYDYNNALVRCNRGEYIETKAGHYSKLFGPGSIFTVMSVHHEDQSRPFIGFSRYKTHLQKYSAGDVITFTGIIMDEGNYFLSNQFVCPVDGSYYFLLNLRKYSTHNVEAYLKHGDQTVFKLEDTQRPNGFNTISNSAVIRCLKGDVVKVVSAGRGRVYGYSKKWNTFSGFLV